MSFVVSSIKDYLTNCSDRPSLAKFVDSHKETVKNFIQQFDQETQAKENLVNKYILAYENVFPHRKRITGKAVNLGSLFAEARLEAGFSLATEAARRDLVNTNESHYDDGEETEDTSNSSDDEEETVENFTYASNGYNMKQGFRKFRNEARALAKSQGLFVNGNLQHLLALDDILLLVKSQHCQEILTCIGNENLSCYHNDLKSKFLDLQLRVEKELVAELASVMTDIEDSSRKNTKCQLFRLYEDADELDTKILGIFLSYIDKLPNEPLINHKIKEIELITKFLDPVLNGMLNDPSTNHNFNWTNTCGTGTEDERPDAEMVILNQRTIDYTIGYCEVKINANSSNSADIHNDLLRLARFGKRLCDEENLQSSLLVMAVGFKLTFYLMVMQNGFHTVFELYCIDVPSSLASLPTFMANVHKMKRIIHAYHSHCVKRPIECPKRRRRDFMSKEDYKQRMNTSKPKKMKPSLSFN